MAFTYEHPHPAVAVDVAAFTLKGPTLAVLLVRRAHEPFAGTWALPGGFVEIDESLRHAAWRELREETGIRAAYLEQLYAFGQPGRDPRERVISVAYVALIPPDRFATTAGSDADDTAWFDLAELPSLAFDHDRILAKARHALTRRFEDPAMALRLMPDEFTLPELQRAYEQVTGRRVDKRNFRKRIRALGVIEKAGTRRHTGASRPAELYRIPDRMRAGGS